MMNWTIKIYLFTSLFATFAFGGGGGGDGSGSEGKLGGSKALGNESVLAKTPKGQRDKSFEAN